MTSTDPQKSSTAPQTKDVPDKVWPLPQLRSMLEENADLRAPPLGESPIDKTHTKRTSALQSYFDDLDEQERTTTRDKTGS